MEQEYFKHHAVYGSVPQEYFGIENLTKKLTNILVSRIQHHMPKMKEELSNLLQDTSEALISMVTRPPTDINEKFLEYHKMCQTFSVLYGSALNGLYVDKVFTNDTSLQLCANARKEFVTLCNVLRATSPKFNDPSFIQELKQIIIDSRGRELPGFLSMNVFKKLISINIECWRVPSLQCLRVVETDCLRVCEEFLHLKFSQYPHLLSFVFEKVSDIIEATTAKTRFKIELTVDREIEEPFTQNHYFMDTINKLRGERFLGGLTGHLKPLEKNVEYRYGVTRPVIEMKAADLSNNITLWYMKSIGNASNEDQEADDMNIVLQSYWKVALKRYADCIPQIIQKDLLDNIRDSLSAVLVCHDSEKMEAFFEVPQDLQKKRVELEEKKMRLKKAVTMVQELSLAR
mgnify:FL=1